MRDDQPGERRPEAVAGWSDDPAGERWQAAARLPGAPSGQVRPAVERLLSAGAGDEVIEILFAATADRLVGEGTFTRAQVDELISALRRPGAPR